jgi:hypothetical protein
MTAGRGSESSYCHNYQRYDCISSKSGCQYHNNSLTALKIVRYHILKILSSFS